MSNFCYYFCLVKTCCSFIFEISDFIWCWIVRHIAWLWRIFLYCLDKCVWWFSAANFWKHSYAYLKLIEDVASKYFWIIVLFAWFIALKGLGCYKVVSEPCRSNTDQNWVIVPVVCEWHSDTFGTCSVVLTCWLWFCLGLRWLEDLVAMMRRRRRRVSRTRGSRGAKVELFHEKPSFDVQGSVWFWWSADLATRCWLYLSCYGDQWWSEGEVDSHASEEGWVLVG